MHWLLPVNVLGNSAKFQFKFCSIYTGTSFVQIKPCSLVQPTLHLAPCKLCTGWPYKHSPYNSLVIYLLPGHTSSRPTEGAKKWCSPVLSGIAIVAFFPLIWRENIVGISFQIWHNTPFSFFLQMTDASSLFGCYGDEKSLKAINFPIMKSNPNFRL